MKLLPKKLAEYLGDPNQVLLRREVSWVFRWMRRPWPALGIIAYTISKMMPFVIQNLWFRGQRAPALAAPSPGITGIILMGNVAWIGTIIHCSMWWHLLNRRTLGALEKERLRDIVLTQIDRRQLWPALLAAPIILSSLLPLFPMAASVVFGAASMLNFSANLESMKSAGAALKMSDAEAIMFGIVIAFGVILAPLSHAIVISGLTAFVANRVLPSRINSQVGISFLTGLVTIYGPGYLLMVLYFMGITFFSFAIGGFPSSPSPRIGFYFLGMGAIQFLCPPLISMILMRRSVTSLRSERMWRMMCDHAATM